MASGDTLCRFKPQGHEPVVANGAAFDNRNQHPCIDFDDTTSESAVFSDIMPENYAGGGLTVYIHYAATSATSGDVDWDVSFERIGDQQQDLDADGFAAVQSVNGTTVPGISGNVGIVNIEFTDGAQMDSIAVGEGFRMKVSRDVADTAAGDIELRFIEIQEATQSAGPNTAPVADPGGPYNGITGQVLALNGTGSSDVDLDPLTYLWDIDGQAPTGPTPNVTINLAGSYPTGLIVNDGTVSSPRVATTTTIVDPVPPSAGQSVNIGPNAWTDTITSTISAAQQDANLNALSSDPTVEDIITAWSGQSGAGLNDVDYFAAYNAGFSRGQALGKW